MALTIREKKLAVLWLADQAVVNRLIDTYCPMYKHLILARQQKLVPEVMKDFTTEEQAEFKDLDSQIPKE